MVRKKHFLKHSLTLIIVLLLCSCRQESLLQENEYSKTPGNYKVYTINKEQVKSDFFLFDKVASVQQLLSNKNTVGSKNAKTAQDSLLIGGVVGINKVLVVENNGQKTYTFALKRNYPTSKIENLVLKKNPDSTFSGKLIQYNITLKEKDYFNSWHSVDLKGKVKIFNIEHLNIPYTNKSYTVNFGCFSMDYQDGWCSAMEHFYTDPDAHKCTAG